MNNSIPRYAMLSLAWRFNVNRSCIILKNDDFPQVSPFLLAYADRKMYLCMPIDCIRVRRIHSFAASAHSPSLQAREPCTCHAPK